MCGGVTGMCLRWMKRCDDVGWKKRCDDVAHLGSDGPDEILRTRDADQIPVSIIQICLGR